MLIPGTATQDDNEGVPLLAVGGGVGGVLNGIITRMNTDGGQGKRRR